MGSNKLTNGRNPISTEKFFQENFLELTLLSLCLWHKFVFFTIITLKIKKKKKWERECVENLNGSGDSFADEARVRLPRTQSDRRDLSAGVQLKEWNWVRHFLEFFATKCVDSTLIVCIVMKQRDETKWNDENVSKQRVKVCENEVYLTKMNNHMHVE